MRASERERERGGGGGKRRRGGRARRLGAAAPGSRVCNQPGAPVQHKHAHPHTHNTHHAHHARASHLVDRDEVELERVHRGDEVLHGLCDRARAAAAAARLARRLAVLDRRRQPDLDEAVERHRALHVVRRHERLDARHGLAHRAVERLELRDEALARRLVVGGGDGVAHVCALEALGRLDDRVEVCCLWVCDGVGVLGLCGWPQKRAAEAEAAAEGREAAAPGNGSSHLRGSRTSPAPCCCSRA